MTRSQLKRLDTIVSQIERLERELTVAGQTRASSKTMRHLGAGRRELLSAGNAERADAQ